ncbi:MAG: choice-of-anchor M domain-containing protein [Isosphaeraceae bacterium]|nr:choice-of-anchor M domain-containing protein [Isosphaeraceae bacterium]
MLSKIRFLALAIALGLAAGTARAGQFDDFYTAGHGDIDIHYEGGELHLGYHLGATAVVNGFPLGAAGEGEFEADTISVIVGANGLVTGNAGLPAPFAGNPLWTLPQANRPMRPFLGIATEEIEPGTFEGGALTLSLIGFVQRPMGGEFVLYQGGDEAAPFFNSANGFSGDDLTLYEGNHDHFVYGFTKEGIYDVILRATGVLEETGESLSVTETFRFRVGTIPSVVVPEPATLASAAFAVVLGGLALRPRRGN